MFISFLRDGIRLQLMRNRTLIRRELEFISMQIGVYFGELFMEHKIAIKRVP
jgi:hypothetical protein